MKEHDDNQSLSGNIQMDDAYLGGERPGGKRGRGAAGKTPFVAAVQTNGDGHPIAMRLSKLQGVRKTELAAWAQKHLRAATYVVSDDLNCFTGITTAGCAHETIVTGGGPASVNHEALTWVNTMLGNVKNAIQGTYHGISDQHAPRYLAEFGSRFNRRFDLP